MSATKAMVPRRLALWLSVAACAVSAFWIADGVAPWDGDRSNVWHQYEFLAEGFLHGHTYLSVEPSPQLLALKDPYDPAENAAYRLWDASLYRGKYYLYYGPAPALVLMAPWEALTGHVLPQRLAVAVFAAFGVAGLGLLLWEVRSRYFPGLSAVALSGILIATFHASWLPVVLRRPGIWELPIVSSTACLWWALYFLWKFHDSGGKARWAVATGVMLAVLMGCRITFLFAAGAIAALSLVRAQGAARRGFLSFAGPALAFAGGVALLLYNHGRYGRWLEFGQSYQLWGEDYRGIRFFNPALIPFNAWTYLFSWPSFGPYFPFLHPFWANPFPAGYMGFEEIYGALFMMPVHLAGLVALAWAWRNRASEDFAAARIVLGAAALASVFSGMVLFCWAGACSRYMTELLAGWTVVAMLGMCAVFGTGGRAARFLTAAAACWTIACVWLASAEFRGFMKQTNPRTYSAVAHVLDYPSTWWAETQGVRFGPVDLQVRIPTTSGFGETVLLANGRPQRVNQLLVEGAGGGYARLELAENTHSVLETPAIPAPSGRLHIRLDAPWLYPPAESPYWDGIADPAVRKDRETLYSIRWDGRAAEIHSALSADAITLEPAVRRTTSGELPAIESMGPAPKQ
jgi:hypothetical protein